MNTFYYPRWLFIGSKLSMIPWIFEKIDFQYSTVLDLFGGSGIVSHEFRLRQKKVFYNDFLIHLQKSVFGLLNVTRGEVLEQSLISSILENLSEHIDSLFKEYVTNKYFFSSEASWIDTVYRNIQTSKINTIQQSLLFFTLIQSCLRKRPFHTFHGSFLNLRLKQRSKPQTWDIDLADSFRKTVNEINSFILNLPKNLPPVTISGLNASKAKPEDFTDEAIDVVYLDPPFISNKKKRTLKFANYVKNYHILELLAQYEDIRAFLDPSTNELIPERYLPVQEMELWLDQNQKKWLQSFEQIVRNFQSSTIIISYRSDSLITKEEIKAILGNYKKVKVYESPHIYEKANKESKFDDLLFIGT